MPFQSFYFRKRESIIVIVITLFSISQYLINLIECNLAYNGLFLVRG